MLVLGLVFVLVLVLVLVFLVVLVLVFLVVVAWRYTCYLLPDTGYLIHVALPGPSVPLPTTATRLVLPS